ncbi:hypothetical protein T07_13016 [Trichinella nelsoni]|uniref:SCAN domain-containing protein 3 n=1 Tax=Trichinella nelsoni TaxID=6336 RepID=A0A0V0RI63_9BILA|nr:hypothetical protein T07_13016 [Trichinella nelsoni]
MLFARPLITNTKGQLAFLVVEEFFKEKEIPLTNLLTVRQMVLWQWYAATFGCTGGAAVEHLVAKRLTQSDKEPSLRDSMKKCKSDIAYMTDLFSKFNELHLQLQRSELYLIKTRSLALFKRNFGRREIYQFPSVAALRKNGEVHDDDIEIYCDHLDMLQKDMQERFQDILKMEIPNCVIDRFSNTDETEMELDEELIELLTTEELKLKFKNGYHYFWLQHQIADLYIRLWAVVRKFLLASASSNLVERDFRVVTDLSTKKRNRLQIAKRGDL